MTYFAKKNSVMLRDDMFVSVSKGEPVEIHPPFLDQTSHDSSLSILVFYSWIGVVTVMVIGAFIALKHRHRVSAVRTSVCIICLLYSRV